MCADDVADVGHQEGYTSRSPDNLRCSGSGGGVELKSKTYFSGDLARGSARVSPERWPLGYNLIATILVSLAMWLGIAKLASIPLSLFA